MAVNQVLLSILQFVALVSPALALLMQVIQERDSGITGGLRILEMAFTLMIFGGILIGYQVIISIENTATLAGTIFVFGSLIFVAVAIWWRFVPIQISLRSDSPTELVRKLIIAAGNFLVILIDLSLFIVIYSVTKDYFNSNLNLGPIRNVNQITPSLLFGVVVFLLFTRLIMSLVENNHLPFHDFSDFLTTSIGWALAYIVFYPLVTAPVFALFIFLSRIEFIGYGPSSSVYLIPYLWAVIALLIILATEIGGTEDD